MNNSFSYRIITITGTKYNKKTLDVPVIECNIDESRVINNDDLNAKICVIEVLGYDRYYLSINEDTFNKYIVPNFVYPTDHEDAYVGASTYLGTVIIKNDKGYNVLTYVLRYDKTKIILVPVISLNNVTADCRKHEVIRKPTSRRIKMFYNNDDLKAYLNKRDEEKTKNWSKVAADYETTYKMAPVFSMKTPKFKVVEVVKKTNYLKDIKPGDIIYGEIPVIKSTDTRKFGALHGIGTYTNWINIYINDKKVTTISPKTFPSLFFSNIIVEEI